MCPLGDKKSLRYGADGRQLTSCQWNELLARNTWSEGIPSYLGMGQWGSHVLMQ